jgi:hypothetical protein
MILETFFLAEEKHAHSVFFLQDLSSGDLSGDNSKKRPAASRRIRPRPAAPRRIRPRHATPRGGPRLSR